MTYPTPANLSSMNDIFLYANTVSGNVYGPGMILSLYFIILLYLKNRGEDLPDCMIAAGWVTSISSIFVFMMGLISGRDLFITIFACVIGAVWSFAKKT